MIKLQNYNIPSRKVSLDIFVGATFFAAVFQDLLMVIAGINNRLPFGFMVFALMGFCERQAQKTQLP